jgi:hypothetical protein
VPRRPEARLEAELLLEVGDWQELSLFKNESGQGYYGTVRHMLEQLAAKGPLELAAGWREVLYRNRLAFGLGVGSPDLVGHLRGMFVGLELKADRGRVRPKQRKWIEAERRKGARVEVIRSVAEALAFLEGTNE